MTFDDVLERMAAIHRAKNADYGSSYTLAALLGIPVHVGLLVRMTDKLAPAAWLKGRPHRWRGRHCRTTLLDLANYAVLALLSLQEKDSENEKNQVFTTRS